MRYKLITGDNPVEFSQQVDGYLRSGYKLHGETQVIQTKEAFNIYYTFFQAVVQED